jgi:hypothetical protein
MEKLPKYVLHKIFNRIPYHESQNVKNINKETKQYIETRTKTKLLRAIRDIPTYKWYNIINGYTSVSKYSSWTTSFLDRIDQLISLQKQIQDSKNPYSVLDANDSSIFEILFYFYESLIYSPYSDILSKEVFDSINNILDNGYDVNLNYYNGKLIDLPFLVLLLDSFLSFNDQYKIFQLLLSHGLDVHKRINIHEYFYDSYKDYVLGLEPKDIRNIDDRILDALGIQKSELIQK